jgi:hypothetical protein
VAEAGTVIDIVAPDHLAEELLEEVVFLVGALRRRKPGHTVGAVRPSQILEPLGEEVDSIFPGRLAERSVGTPEQRGGKALLAVDEPQAVTTLDAQHAVADRVPLGARGADDLPALPVDVQGKPAADAAVGAEGVNGVGVSKGPGGSRFVEESTGGAELDTLAAVDAVRLSQGKVFVADDPPVGPPPAEIENVVDDLRAAGGDTAAAADTELRAPHDHRRGTVDGWVRAIDDEIGLFHPEEAGRLLEFAKAVGLAGVAVVAAIGKQERDQAAPYLHERLRVSAHRHSGDGGKATGNLESLHALDLHDTEPAVSRRARFPVPAE